MAEIVPYINFVNRGKEAAVFYRGVFGGDAELQAEDDRVLHLDFTAGGVHFMGSDLGEDQPGRESSVVLNCDDEQQLRTYYSRLVENGREVYAPTDSGWGAIVAHCVDQFGVTWMFNFDLPDE